MVPSSSVFVCRSVLAVRVAVRDPPSEGEDRTEKALRRTR